MPKAQRDEIKDKGGFVGGEIKGNRRKSENVTYRSLLVYDLDSVTDDFLSCLPKYISHKAIYYTTHSHSPQKPRIRVIVFLSKDIPPDEFNAVARYYAAEQGFIEYLDPCSFSATQLMYWPSVSVNGEYLCGVIDGDDLDPDEILDKYPNWQDYSVLPTTPAESQAEQRSVKRQADPLEKSGVIGLFCRTYTIQSAMATFLSDVYAPSETDDSRYDYIPGEGSCGVVVYDDKFAYSHHATDPAGGKLCNAFDLVRIHKFGDLDDKQSFKAMSEYAMKDELVCAEALRLKQSQSISDFSSVDEDKDWQKKLQYEKKSAILKNSLHNIRLIMQNDTYMKNIVFNQLADGMEIRGEVPWKHPGKFWRDADDAQLVCYVDDKYGTFSQSNYDIAITKVVDDRSYHPIKEYFDSLPPWDSVPRVDTLLIDYLGAQDNEYTRAVTRKTLCAAVDRIYCPGIKFDCMPVLNGNQGIGKSTLIAKLGGEWFSDSLTLSDMNDKTAAEKLQGYWIHEIGELAGMRKADIDKVKAFVSRQDDKYRASFGRRVTPHPRQCIFFGTTNSENGYLRDITGNRRFWNVTVTGEGKYKPWDMDEELVKQIWAETISLAKAGEKLFLEGRLEDYAKNEQRQAMEQDEREGIVREFLDMPLPANWSEMDVYERHSYFRDKNDPTRPEGIQIRQTVSNMEIWCECFGKNQEDIRPSDSYAISAMMVKIDEWERSNERCYQQWYGRQRIYRRK